jgi:hypothetical protein
MPELYGSDLRQNVWGPALAENLTAQSFVNLYTLTEKNRLGTFEKGKFELSQSLPEGVGVGELLEPWPKWNP